MRVAWIIYIADSAMKEIQDSYKPVSRISGMSVLAPVCEAEVLVPDELGASKPTAWALDAMTYIIGRCYNQELETLAQVFEIKLYI